MGSILEFTLCEDAFAMKLATLFCFGALMLLASFSMCNAEPLDCLTLLNALHRCPVPDCPVPDCPVPDCPVPDCPLPDCQIRSPTDWPTSPSAPTDPTSPSAVAKQKSINF